MTRPDWNTYYLDIAKAVAARGDCRRAQHGAVIVKDHRIVATGYNGTPPGHQSCLDTGLCPRAMDKTAQHSQGDYDLCWSTHAEANAIIRGDYDAMRGGFIYITGQPCGGCAKLIRSAGLSAVW